MPKPSDSEPTPSTPPGSRESSDELLEIVEHFRVCWEKWPLQYPSEAGDLVQVGFEIDLLGTPPGDRGSLLPGQDRTYDLFQSLGRVAAWALGQPPPTVSYHIEVFDGSVNYARPRHDRPDVVLKIEITHRERYTAPLDDEQRQYASEVITALESLGVQPGAWRAP